MKKSTARAYQRTGMVWVGAALCVLSAVSMIWGNIGKISGASVFQILLYVVFPSIASLGLGLLTALRLSPLYTVIPAALGCTVYVLLESYLTLLFTDPSSFSAVWVYLGSGNIACILLASVCMAFGCLLYILCAMGVLHSDLLPMVFLGLAAFSLLGEYLLTILGGAYNASPWYMLSAVMFLLALIVSVVCFEPEYDANPRRPRRTDACTARAADAAPDDAADADTKASTDSSK